MPRKHRSIVIIPPTGKRVRISRIRIGVALALIILTSIGYVGFWIPFKALGVEAVEKNQKKNLSEQNRKLLQRIHIIQNRLHDFGARLDLLQAQKQQIEKTVVIPSQSTTQQARKTTALPSENLDDVLKRSVAAKAFYEQLVKQTKTDTQYFAAIPIIKPVPQSAAMVALFGKQIDPFTGSPKWHNGIDFAALQKTPVIATASGVVSMVENHRLWGLRIQITHANGLATVYAHLGQVMTSTGRKVVQGDVIGSIGVSGLTTGPHVHYEILQNGRPVDPLDYFYPETAVATALEP
jgi:murein DD-endopeptidase MepM/ murein hydrolase activator NlpD